VIIPRGIQNNVAIHLICTHISNLLEQRGIFSALKKDLDVYRSAGQEPRNVHVIKSSPEIVALLTKIRDTNATRTEFIFHSDRLSRLLIEYSMEW
jgi:hypothetical protein